MSYLLNAALKGIIEGFTEFLPISSTGHLVLVGQLLPLSAGTAEETQRLNALFDLVIQLPAILAIVVLYRRRLWESARSVMQRSESRRFWSGLALAFLPIGAAGFLLKDVIETSLRQPSVVAIALVTGGVVLLLVEKFVAQGSVSRAEDASLAKALGIGLFQCLSLIPGTSRSGATIVGGRLLGLDRMAAAEFSFFLALPTMCAACAYKLALDYQHIDWSAHGSVLLIGCVASFITALAVVALFMRLLGSRYGLVVWGWYRIVLGLLVLAIA